MNVFPAPPLLFAKHMPALFFFVTRKTERKKGNASRVCVCQPTCSIQSAYNFGFQRVEKNALGRKERMCFRVKKMRKEKKRRYAYALCVGDILFEDDEFVCVCVCV
jgi:hypothetical protein